MLREHLTSAISDAVLDELAEVGFARLSMEAVARRVGSGKSALYRRWPSKVEMVSAALADLSVPVAQAPDTGSLHGDLVELVQSLVGWLTDARVARIVPDLVAEAARTPALAEAMAATTGSPRRAHARTVFRRGIERGELPADTDLDLALDLPGGLVYWRLVTRHAAIDADYVEKVVVLTERALGAGPPH